MAKFQSPLLGYNNNVRHKNRVFHIQTEDSGVNHPHIITHLFMDGGRILKSVKKSYAEHIGAEGMQETVRGLMKEQHKAIFIALRDGQFDHLVDPNAAKPAPAPAAVTAPPAEAAAVTTGEAPASVAPVAGAAPAVPPPAAPARSVPPAAVAMPSVAPAPAAVIGSRGLILNPSVAPAAVIGAPRASAPIADAATASGDLAAAPHAGDAAASDATAASAAAPVPPPSAPSAPPTTPEPLRLDVDLAPNTIDETKRPLTPSLPPPTTARQPLETRPDAVAARAAGGRELTLDFDALDRAAQEGAAASPAPSLFHSNDLPPPPKNLFTREAGTGGAYRAVEPDPRHDAREEAGSPVERRSDIGPRRPGRSLPPPPSTRGERAPVTSAQGAPRVPPSRATSDARYAPARPAAIFGSTQRQPPASLFSDELVSDKSLDEVILSYLAEDLEPPRRK